MARHLRTRADPWKENARKEITMKKTLILLLALCLSATMLTACGAAAVEYQQFSTAFFGTFDTIIIIKGYAEEKSTFDRVTQEAQDMFIRLHKVFDAYNAYEGINNLYALNENAKNGPTPVEPELMDLLLYIKEEQPKTQGTVNVALGSVLRIWHDFREEYTANPLHVSPPAADVLAEAAKHADLGDVVLDPEAGTVAFLDSELILDVGAVAKGYAAERVAQRMLASDMPSFIINAGGNVRAGEAPLDGRLYWGISIQTPDGVAPGEEGSDMLDTLFLAGTSVVTSGDYQRYITLDGVRYHHIISPETLYPADYLRAVTVVTEDSAYADMLSTALFLMPYEQGLAYVEGLEGVEAMWVLPDGAVLMTDGLTASARSHGATALE